jgi:hypothetical protein
MMNDPTGGTAESASNIGGGGGGGVKAAAASAAKGAKKGQPDGKPNSTSKKLDLSLNQKAVTSFQKSAKASIAKDKVPNFTEVIAKKTEAASESTSQGPINNDPHYASKPWNTTEDLTAEKHFDNTTGGSQGSYKSQPLSFRIGWQVNFHFNREGGTANEALYGAANHTPFLAAGNAFTSFHHEQDLAGRESSQMEGILFTVSAVTGLAGLRAGAGGGGSNAGGSTFYRAMSTAEYNAFKSANGLTHMPGKELFVSSSSAYSRVYLQKYGYDVLVRFNMKPGAMKYFNEVGVFHRTAAGSSGWAGRGNLLWKSEQGAMNLGIQQNTHMFNPWIQSFKTIR